MQPEFTKLRGPVSVEVSQTEVGVYDNGQLFWRMPLEVWHALSKDATAKLKKYGLAG